MHVSCQSTYTTKHEALVGQNLPAAVLGCSRKNATTTARTAVDVLEDLTNGMADGSALLHATALLVGLLLLFQIYVP